MIFFAFFALRSTRYLLIDEYIDTLLQKAGVPGVASSLEAIQKAKTIKNDLEVIWLDLANAYWSLLHQMSVLSLPLRVFGLLSSYLLLFPQRFGRYVPGLLQVFVKLRNFHGTSNKGDTCSDSISHNQVLV